jgi:hypothetical protein
MVATAPPSVKKKTRILIFVKAPEEQGGLPSDLFYPVFLSLFIPPWGERHMAIHGLRFLSSDF